LPMRVPGSDQLSPRPEGSGVCYGSQMLYNAKVIVRALHGWEVDFAEARRIQRSLASRVVAEGALDEVGLVAGVDISAPDARGVAKGAVVVLSYPELEVVEVRVAEGMMTFPYLSGLLSFRESPLILAACEGLGSAPDLIIVDGQGVAHPRRLGLASHVGLLLDLPAIGCAKSVLCGRHGPLGEEAGARADLLDGGEVIGAALRTRAKVRPVYVSVGHRIGLDSALAWVMQCCRGYRVPEPTRLAHLAAGGRLTVEAKERQGPTSDHAAAAVPGPVSAGISRKEG
jgi:deoxyribonuclease V